MLIWGHENIWTIEDHSAQKEAGKKKKKKKKKKIKKIIQKK